MMEVRYVQRRKVTAIKEFTHRQHIKGGGASAEFETVTRGWGVTLEPGYDTYFVGREKPMFQIGQYVKFIIEGVVEDAAASATTGK